MLCSQCPSFPKPNVCQLEIFRFNDIWPHCKLNLISYFVKWLCVSMSERGKLLWKLCVHWFTIDVPLFLPDLLSNQDFNTCVYQFFYFVYLFWYFTLWIFGLLLPFLESVFLKFCLLKINVHRLLPSSRYCFPV